MLILRREQYAWNTRSNGVSGQSLKETRDPSCPRTSTAKWEPYNKHISCVGHTHAEAQGACMHVFPVSTAAGYSAVHKTHHAVSCCDISCRQRSTFMSAHGKCVTCGVGIGGAGGTPGSVLTFLICLAMVCCSAGASAEGALTEVCVASKKCISSPTPIGD